MSTVQTALTKCIMIVEEDLDRYKRIQQQDSKALGVSEARAIKDYLTALASAYRAAGAIDLKDEDLKDLTDEELEAELLSRLKEEKDD